MQRIFTRLLSVVLLLLVTLTGMGGADDAQARPSWTGFYQTTPDQIALPPGTLLKYEPMRLPPFLRAKAWRILYATRDYASRPIAASGLVVLPDYAAKSPAERTIVAWAHPTVGIARYCAPSLSKTPLGSILGMNELISSGHIIAATDYPGLGTTGPIGYLVGRGQAYAVIDAARAARQIPVVGGSNRYALWGYSQGGHAALFAAALSRVYAPELKLQGVAATAPPTDLARLLQADLGTMEGRIFASFAMGSWSRKYGVALDQIADSQALRSINTVNNSCTTDINGLLDLASAQEPLATRFLNADPTRTPPWSQIIKDNSIWSLPAGSASLILQGESDGIVRPSVTLQFVKMSCRNGARIKYSLIKTKGHAGAAPASVPEAIGWINARFQGKPAPTSCQ